jgi:hypothetical protein
MKLPLRLPAIMVAALTLSPGLSAAQQKPGTKPGSKSTASNQQTLTGVISDALCGRKHVMAGKTDAQCTRECVQRSSKYALIVGDKVYTLEGGPDAKLDELAGERVVLSGTVRADTIQVSSVVAANTRGMHP